MNRFRITPSIIPNLFTAMNMFSGFLSIIYASQGKFNTSGWLIIVAAIFDALDGLMARLTKSSSELGVELDSLSDVVSFGAAPSFLIYSTYLYKYEAWGIIISSLPLIAAGFRLARFNVQLVGFDKSFFRGLPTPSSAITIAAFIIAFYQTNQGFNQPYNMMVIPLIFLLSFLMVSRIKYDTFPKLSKKELKEKPYLLIYLIIIIILFIFFPVRIAVFFIFIFIILFGIFRHIFYRKSRISQTKT
jgi:CDP-diacylglycerol--serine O-phosphatidyltransferase